MPLANALGHAPLFSGTTQQVEDSYAKAIAAGAGEAAVVLLDLTDPLARGIAERHLGGDAVRALLQTAPAPDAVPIATWGMPRALMVEHFDPDSEIARCVSVPLGNDHYWVVIVADGSISGVMVPAPARVG